jgi:hypothetical protein
MLPLCFGTLLAEKVSHMGAYERSRKISQLDTIWYEISMLGFTHSALTKMKQVPEPESNLYIEGFLLHYRNLIQFFSGNPDKYRKGGTGKPADLSTFAPEAWAKRKLTDDEIAKIQAPARQLEQKYWDDISQFLQHCTERRFVEFKDWNLAEMFKELDPIVSAFHKSFPHQEEPRRPNATVLSSNGAHTATITVDGWTFKEWKQ